MKTEPETSSRAFDGSCRASDMEGAHAAAIQRMIRDTPPFRPEASPEELVAEFADGKNRMAAFLALYGRGAKALPAIREGLKHADWQIRRWSAMCVDNFADGETLRALTPLLHDPRPEVRAWAVHSLSCESCKDGPNPIDAVPLLLERIEQDKSLKVRRQAIAMLAHHRSPDARVVPVFKKVLSEEGDRKLRLHAEQGLERYAAAGLAA
jgi:HEAT repeat protein